MTQPVVRPHEASHIILGGITWTINPATGQKVRLVYQRVKRGLGNIKNLGERDLQMRLEPPREDAHSEPQMMLRHRMATAVKAYQALSDSQRTEYKRKARHNNRTGYNLFIAEFCAAHPIEEFIEDRVKLEFYSDSLSIARPFSVLKFYLLER